LVLLLVLWVPVEAWVINEVGISWRVDESVRVEAPPDVVRAWISDATLWPSWQPTMEPPESWNLRCEHVQTGTSEFRWGGRLGYSLHLVRETDDMLLFWLNVDDVTPIPVRIRLASEDDGAATRIEWSSHGNEFVLDLIPWRAMGLERYSSHASVEATRDLADGLVRLAALVESVGAPQTTQTPARDTP